MPVGQILLATTTQWPIAARLAVVLTDLDVSCTVICPRGNPALELADPVASSIYDPRAPIRALERTITNSGCDLIIACDDRVVRHLHILHATNDRLRPVIERSIGPPDNYAVTENRVALLQIATAAGLRVPESHAVPNRAALSTIARTMPFPWVMKADGTWGGAGVRRVDNLTQARRGLYWLGRVLNAARALDQFVFHHNPYPLFELPGAGAPRISVQRFIEGEPVTILAASWRGELLAAVCAEVLCTQRRYGASTVVRTINQPEMLEAARVIAGRLGLSGFFGLDFVMANSTQVPHLIDLGVASLRPTLGYSAPPLHGS